MIQTVLVHNNLFYSCMKENYPSKPGNTEFRTLHIISVLYFIPFFTTLYSLSLQSLSHMSRAVYECSSKQKYLVKQIFSEIIIITFKKVICFLQLDFMPVQTQGTFDQTKPQNNYSRSEFFCFFLSHTWQYLRLTQRSHLAGSGSSELATFSVLTIGFIFLGLLEVIQKYEQSSSNLVSAYHHFCGHL